MQSISLGSLKLEAHHDKIINEVAQTTKLYFLSKELDFLRELRNQAQDLQVLAKPRLEPQTNLEEFIGKAQAIKKTFEREVILTRRNIAHLEMQSSNHFQAKVEAHYQKAVTETNQKLQLTEALVQKRQDYNKSNGTFKLEKYVAFKDKTLRLMLEKYLKKKEEVKQQIKRRLFIGGMLKDKKEKFDRYILREAKKQNFTFRGYHFATKERKYYPNKSLDRRQFEPYAGNDLRKAIRNRQPRYQISLRTKRDYQEIPVKRSLLVSLQEEIFQQALQSTKNQNNKLQVQIQLIEKAIERKEASQTLQKLVKEKQIETQRAKARQILAYMQMQQSFKDKLEACSYRWTMTKNLQAKYTGKSKEWNQQYQHYPERLYIKRQRDNSADKCRPLLQPQLDFKAQGFKSNERTNTSHERL